METSVLLFLWTKLLHYLNFWLVFLTFFPKKGKKGQHQSRFPLGQWLIFHHSCERQPFFVTGNNCFPASSPFPVRWYKSAAPGVSQSSLCLTLIDFDRAQPCALGLVTFGCPSVCVEHKRHLALKPIFVQRERKSPPADRVCALFQKRVWRPCAKQK